VAVKNLAEGTLQEIRTDGVFIAVGEKPNSELAASIGVALTEGFISVDRNGRTNIPRVYAAGDVTGGVWQIVTEVSEGVVAALAAFADLAKPQR
jgi:thioredoxin reductase (NADPH)